MNTQLKVSITYEVKGLDYSLCGEVCEVCSEQREVFAIVDNTVLRLKKAYEGYEVAINNVYVS